MAAQEESLLQATETFHFVRADGVPIVVNRGAIVRIGHPLINGREALFAPLTVDFEHGEPAKPGRHAPQK